MNNMLAHPWKLLLLAFILLLLGLLLPLFMVLRVLPSTFFLNFFAYAASFSGMILGLIGAVLYGRVRSK
jgi:membrane associated rhomboid family serine protease